MMVAFNFGDAVDVAFQSFDVNWFRFAKSCMRLNEFEKGEADVFVRHEFLRSVMT